MIKRIPFVPVYIGKAKKVSRHFFGLGESLSGMFPGLRWQLRQAEFDIEPREWVGIAMYVGFFYFSLTFLLIFSLALMYNVVLRTAFLVSFFSGIGMGFSTFFYISLYPKLFVNRKVRNLEKNLPSALRHLLVHVRSGVPFFNSLVSIAYSGYGLLSDEFLRAVKEIDTGFSEISALELLARENPSLFFRRVVWQIVNAMKSGADIGMTIKEIVTDMGADQKAAIKKYGSELNPLILFYMVLVVIFPTLGIVFLLILSSFVAAAFDMQVVMTGVLIFLVVVQLMFIGLVKSKRPLGID